VAPPLPLGTVPCVLRQRRALRRPQRCSIPPPSPCHPLLILLRIARGRTPSVLHALALACGHAVPRLRSRRASPCSPHLRVLATEPSLCPIPIPPPMVAGRDSTPLRCPGAARPLGRPRLAWVVRAPRDCLVCPRM